MTTDIYPWLDYFSLREEVGLYNSRLLWRPAIILANKMDLTEAHDNLVVFKEKLKLRAKQERRTVPPIFPISAKDAMDLQPVISVLARMVPSPTMQTTAKRSTLLDDEEDDKHKHSKHKHSKHKRSEQ
jgi:GTPase